MGKLFKFILGISGLLFFLLLFLSFTALPYYAYHWLGTANSELKSRPDVIVLLGGSGMPSPDGLIRSYYAAESGLKYKNAEIIIALPYNENDQDSLRQLDLMARELKLKGIEPSRIQYEPLGFNTRSQALQIAGKFKKDKNKTALLLVTSPEHMFRSVKTFIKAGFPNVSGVPAFEKPVDEEKVKDTELTRDIRVKSLLFRYNIWSYLNYELIVMREYCAISYYKFKGWI